MIDFESSGASEPDLNGAAQPAVAVRRSAASALLSAVQIWSMSASSPAAAPAQIAASTEARDAQGTSSGQADIPDGAQARRARPSRLLAEARFFSSSARRIQDPVPTPEPTEPTMDLSAEFRRRLDEASHA
jgi:hypothetical protein